MTDLAPTTALDLPAVAKAAASHPWVAHAASTQGGVVATVAEAPVRVRDGEVGELVAEYLEHWGEVYSWTYASTALRHGDDLDLSGWRASDTGEPLPKEHMEQWVDRTVELILDQNPRSVLELGCGTGLLAHRLRGRVEAYVGTDVAPDSVARLAAGAIERETFLVAAAHQVQRADVLEAVARSGVARPSLVVINSVTQCFGSVDYLASVVRQSLELVGPGGGVLVGDNRHSALGPAYCHWIERSLDPMADAGTVSARAARRLSRDDELQLDPLLLAAIARGHDSPVTLTARPKLLSLDTELTRYRFDAVLRCEAETVTLHEVPGSHLCTVDEVIKVLTAQTNRTWRLVGIPHRAVSPIGMWAAALHDAIKGADVDAVVEISLLDPGTLEVVPREHAGRSVDVIPGMGRAHAPFEAFVRRRVSETVRAVARRQGLVGADQVVNVVVTDVPREFACGTALPGSALHAAASAGEAAVPMSACTAVPTALASIDDAAVTVIAATVHGSRVFADPGRVVTAAEVASALGAAPPHFWIVRRWLAHLVAAQRLEVREGGFTSFVRPSRSEISRARASLPASCAEVGYPPAYAAFLTSAFNALPDLVTGASTVQSLLFADGDVEAAIGAYGDNRVNRYLNSAVGGLAVHQARRQPGTPVRVLELGGGVAVTAGTVLRALTDEGFTADYLFTDVSPFFLERAKALLGHPSHGRLSTAHVDINNVSHSRLVDGHHEGHDVVIAANVLHNAVDLPATLARVAAELAPGGLLAVIDTTRELTQLLASMAFLMSTDGDLPGAHDRRAGTDQIMLPSPQWQAHLEATGLKVHGVLPDTDHPLSESGVVLIIAERVAPR